MKKILYLIVLTAIFSCVKLDPLEDQDDKIWIGKWDNSQEHFEIRENGHALWNTNKAKDGAGILDWDLWVEGTVNITADELEFREQRKIIYQIIPAGARKKRLKITQAPTEEINPNGEPVIYCILNGKRFSKSQ